MANPERRLVPHSALALAAGRALLGPPARMLPAALTTLFFSISIIFAARSARSLGGPQANVARLTVALVLLGLWAHLFGAGLRGPSLPWFLFSGFVGFGLGDIALFGALPRIGPRLAILLTQCLAAPLAALAEWLWLGSPLHALEILCGGVVLLGVALALAPDHGWPTDPAVFWAGVWWGVGSALGQAFGAVISRRAFDIAAAAHFSIDGGTAAYQRIVAGTAFTWIVFLLAHSNARSARRDSWSDAAPWVLINALAGPVIGVACFQWALQGTRSGIVLPIIATSPLVTLLLTALLDRRAPSRRAVSGGAVAVAGAVCLRLVQG